MSARSPSAHRHAVSGHSCARPSTRRETLELPPNTGCTRVPVAASRYWSSYAHRARLLPVASHLLSAQRWHIGRAPLPFPHHPLLAVLSRGQRRRGTTSVRLCTHRGHLTTLAAAKRLGGDVLRLAAFCRRVDPEEFSSWTAYPRRITPRSKKDSTSYPDSQCPGPSQARRAARRRCRARRRRPYRRARTRCPLSGLRRTL
jgi:hypothetical protein